MSDPTHGPSPPPVRRRRNPFLAALMLIFGLILLLPGLCSIVIIAVGVSNLKQFLSNGDLTGLFLPLWGISFLISAGGIALIVKVFR
jgi:hypothetical protein